MKIINFLRRACRWYWKSATTPLTEEQRREDQTW
jgi:hypothetical protein